MDSLLQRMGEQLVNQRILALLGPGLAFLAALAAADTLGQAHPFDLSALADRVGSWAREPAAGTVGGQVVLIAAVLAGAALLALAVRGLGLAAERLALGADWQLWPKPLRYLAERRTTARLTRWQTAHQALTEHRDQAGRATALGRPVATRALYAARAELEAISTERPDRPTWSGDRLHAAATRLQRDHQVDLVLVWPYIWLNLPDDTRGTISAARIAITQAATLGVWGVCVLALAALWWPAALLFAAVVTVARFRFRAAVDTYAQLLEAAVRLNLADLARRLGVATDGPLTADIGSTLTAVLNPATPNR